MIETGAWAPFLCTVLQEHVLQDSMQSFRLRRLAGVHPPVSVNEMTQMSKKMFLWHMTNLLQAVEAHKAFHNHKRSSRSANGGSVH